LHGWRQSWTVSVLQQHWTKNLRYFCGQCNHLYFSLRPHMIVVSQTVDGQMVAGMYVCIVCYFNAVLIWVMWLICMFTIKTVCVCVNSVIEIKALSHQRYPLTYELTTESGSQSNEFAIDHSSGVVDLLRILDYEKDPQQNHLKVKVIENGRPARTSTVNVCIRRF